VTPPNGGSAVLTEQGTRGFVHCSTTTGCGGRWQWRPDATDEDVRSFAASWTSEQAAREWAASHLTVCDGPVEVVVTHRNGEAA
jgi:hypothetical protein